MDPKILLVDREFEILDDLESLLSEEGHEIRKAASFQDAMTFIKSEHFDLLITDIRIKGGDGFELIKQIKKQDKEIEVIVLTGFVSFENILTALRDYGVCDFLMKPLKDSDQLFHSINRAMQKHKKK